MKTLLLVALILFPLAPQALSSCFTCFLNSPPCPQNSKVVVCPGPGQQATVSIHAGWRSATSTVRYSSKNSVSAYGITVTPKPPKDWGAVSGCADLDITC